jgi:hypothetical protein
VTAKCGPYCACGSDGAFHCLAHPC